jgi:hypothetical protein
VEFRRTATIDLSICFMAELLHLYTSETLGAPEENQPGKETPEGLAEKRGDNPCQKLTPFSARVKKLPLRPGEEQSCHRTNCGLK